MDDAEENGHADAIRGMGAITEGSSGFRRRMAGELTGMHEVTSGSSGYRRRMAGQRTGMHEVDSASSDTSGGSNRSGSSAFRRRKAEEAQELFDEQNWRGRMKEEGEALEAGIAANRDKTDKKIGDLEDSLAWAWERLTELLDDKDTYVRWTPDVDEDAFLCVFKEDTTTTVLVNGGDCFVDGVIKSPSGGANDWRSDTEVTADSAGVIFMKYVISTDTWTGPTFEDARQTPDDDIRYFYLCEVEYDPADPPDAAKIASIKPLHRGDIHYSSAGAIGDWSFKVKNVTGNSSAGTVDVVGGRVSVFNTVTDVAGVTDLDHDGGLEYIALRATFTKSTQAYAYAIVAIASTDGSAKNPPDNVANDGSTAVYYYPLARLDHTGTVSVIAQYHQMGDIYDQRLPDWDTDDAVVQVDSSIWKINDCLAYTS